MDYITLAILLANIVAIVVTYGMNNRDEFWTEILKKKNERIEYLEDRVRTYSERYMNNIETELNELKNAHKEASTINTAFVKMFADNNH